MSAPSPERRRARRAALGLLGLGLASLVAGPAHGQPAGDYDTRSPAWNGLSALAGLAGELRCPLEERALLDWETLTGHDVLLFVYPETAIDEDAAQAFLGAGGRLVLADDFGRGDGALRALGIERRPLPPLSPSVRRHQDKPALPIALSVRATPLGQGTRELTANHPAVLSGRRGGLPATYAFVAPGGDPGLGASVDDLSLVTEGVLGRGRFVALADPSVFINNMLELPGNRAFAARLISDLCRRGAGGDHLVLLRGAFTQRGAPPAVLLGAPSAGGVADLADQWNRAFSGANLHIQEVLTAARTRLLLDAASLVGLVLALAALALALRYLPLSAAPHDQGFAQAPRPPEAGLPALVARYAQRQVPWGFLYPAALLREEVLRRLSPYLTDLVLAEERRRAAREGVRGADASLGALDLLSPAVVAARLREAVSPAAGQAAGPLWSELRALPSSQILGTPGVPGARAWIPERRLRRLHEQTLTLFAALTSAAEDAARPAAPPAVR